MLIDINDYKSRVSRSIKKIILIYFILSILFIMGLLIINKSFKYYEYICVPSEYKDKTLNIYVQSNNFKKITNKNRIKIDNRVFAYKVKSISNENIYINNNYYKILELKVDGLNLEENEIVNSKIIVKESTLIEYVFKTVWR